MGSKDWFLKMGLAAVVMLMIREGLIFGVAAKVLIAAFAVYIVIGLIVFFFRLEMNLGEAARRSRH